MSSPRNSHSPTWSPALMSTPSSRDGVADRLGTVDAARRAFEHRQHPVAKGLDAPTAKALDLAKSDLVMGIEQLPPAPVTRLSGAAVESTMSVNRTVARTLSSSTW